MNRQQVTAPARRWLSATLLAVFAPCALGYSSSSVWAPPERGRGNFPPAPEGSLYAPGPSQKHMPPAPPLPHKQIPYFYARQIVIAHGWEPRPLNDVPDKEIYKCGNLNNTEFQNKVCQKFPEVAAISGDGFCKMRFYKNKIQLNIFVYGECSIKNLSRKDHGYADIVGWEVVRFTDY